MPRNFAKNTRWVCANHKIITLHLHPKLLKPEESYLFDLLPTDILVDIDIWLSVLEHRDKFRSVISHINSMYNPVFFAIPHEL